MRIFHISSHDKSWFERVFFDCDIKEIRGFFDKSDLIEVICAPSSNAYPQILVLWLDLQANDVLWIVRRLRANHIAHYHLLTRAEYEWLMNRYYAHYFQQRGIAVDEEILTFGDFRLYNFLLDSHYAIDAGDFILPVFFNDMSLVEDGPYECGNVALTPGDTAIDCGAHIGTFTVWALRRGCAVHAFEPIPETYERLQNTLCLYEQEHAVINKCGLWHSSMCLPFYLSEDGATNSAVMEKKGSIRRYPVIPLDEYADEVGLKRVDFIKADIEGAEKEMLQGARETIYKYHPKLSISAYHCPGDEMEITRIILSIRADYIVEHKWKKIYAYVSK